MHAVTTFDDLGRLEENKALVSVFLASNMNTTFVDWVLKAWPDLHQLSGNKWHLAVPANRGVQPEHLHDIEEHGRERWKPLVSGKVCNSWCESYGIDRKKTPVIIFDNFIDEDPQYYIRLGNFSDNELSRLFFAAADFLRRIPDPPYTDKFRQNTLAQLVQAIERQAWKDRLIQRARHAFSVGSRIKRTFES